MLVVDGGVKSRLHGIVLHLLLYLSSASVFIRVYKTHVSNQMTDSDTSTDGSTVTLIDAKGFIYEPVHGPKRKIEFQPRSDDRFERVEAVWTGCRWRVTGREILQTRRPI